MGTVANVIVGSATLSIKDPFGGSYAEVGYTEDGVNFIYEPETKDVDVDEETVAIDRALIKERIRIRCNLKEATLANLSAVMAGADDGTTRTIKLGGGTINYIAVKLVGTSPEAGYTVRTIEMVYGTAVGAVDVPYKKGEANIIPFEFEALNDGTNDPAKVEDTNS